MFFGILTVLGVGPVAVARARAQDPRPKAEPPRQAAPVPAPLDAQKQQEPAPAAPPLDAQKESAPAAPRLDAQKESAPAAPPRDGQPEPAPASSESLSDRYRFSERYSPTEDPDRREVITQYRVGVAETSKMVRDKPQGGHDRFEWSRTTIYTERAAQVTKGDMTAAVRRYDKVRTKEMTQPRHPLNPPLLQGLEIWYHRRPGEKPQVFSLSSDRRLRESEYDAISEEVFVPQLMLLFPPAPRRVGDTWEIRRQVAQSVWGELPEEKDYKLTGSLIEVGKIGSGTSLMAVIGISGFFTLRDGPNAFNARISFTFDPPPAVTPPAGSGASPKAAETGSKAGAGKRDEGIIEARGWISQALMAQRLESLVPESDGRLKQSLTRELRLERRPLATTPNAPAGGLTPPEPPPTPTEANSWLVFEDPMGRFHFSHPQGLRPNPYEMDPNVLQLVDRQLGAGQDVFILSLPPGAEDPQKDRLFRNPDQFRREIDADWAKSKLEILRGPAGWLPDADWAPLRVYRKEIGVKAEGTDEKGKRVERIYIDYYLVLAKRDECVHVQSMTKRDDHVAFRTQAESMIKSLQFTRPDARPKAPASTPSPPQTRPQ